MATLLHKNDRGEDGKQSTEILTLCYVSKVKISNDKKKTLEINDIVRSNFAIWKAAVRNTSHGSNFNAFSLPASFLFQLASLTPTYFLQFYIIHILYLYQRE